MLDCWVVQGLRFNQCKPNIVRILIQSQDHGLEYLQQHRNSTMDAVPHLPCFRQVGPLLLLWLMLSLKVFFHACLDLHTHDRLSQTQSEAKFTFLKSESGKKARACQERKLFFLRESFCKGKKKFPPPPSKVKPAGETKTGSREKRLCLPKAMLRKKHSFRLSV